MSELILKEIDSSRDADGLIHVTSVVADERFEYYKIEFIPGQNRCFANFNVSETENNDWSPLLTGFIKFDGCMQFYYAEDGQTGPFHICGLESVKEFNFLLESIFELGKKYIPEWDD